MKAISAAIASAAMAPIAIPAAAPAEILSPPPEPDAAPSPEESADDDEIEVGTVTVTVGSDPLSEELPAGSGPEDGFAEAVADEDVSAPTLPQTEPASLSKFSAIYSLLDFICPCLPSSTLV